MNTKLCLLSLFVFLLALSSRAAIAQAPTPAPDQAKVVAFYSADGIVQEGHLNFAQDAVHFFSTIATQDHYNFVATTDWDLLLDNNYMQYVKVVLWLDDQPHTTVQRDAFQRYMEAGGGWLGFHISGYNDRNTNWPWFHNFLGGVVTGAGSWPPLPAKVNVETPSHPVARGLPSSFEAPQNEWYAWTPSPRLDKNVTVLLSLDRSNFPLGIKDVIRPGDVPIVWTNNQFKMIYINMGHGEKTFTSDTQNKLFENSVNWLITR